MSAGIAATANLGREQRFPDGAETLEQQHRFVRRCKASRTAGDVKQLGWRSLAAAGRAAALLDTLAKLDHAERAGLGMRSRLGSNRPDRWETVRNGAGQEIL